MKTNKFFACVLMVFMCTAFACPVWAGSLDSETDSGDSGASSSGSSKKAGKCCPKDAVRLTELGNCCNGSYDMTAESVTEDCCTDYAKRLKKTVKFVPAQNGKKARCCECASTSGSN